MSASIIGMRAALSSFDTVDLPVAMPPVSPITILSYFIASGLRKRVKSFSHRALLRS